MIAWLERYFQLKQHGTSVRTETLGGATTFATMAYIIVANPAILAGAGFPIGPTTVATILVAVVGCLLMGFFANRPFAVAPYMGENAFIAFSLASMKMPDGSEVTPEVRLGTVFVSGVIFLFITLLGLRTWLANSISTSMKHSFAVGIGLFLAFIGLYETGIVGKAPAPDVPVTIGNFRDPKVLLAVAGFAIITLLMIWRVKGAILLGLVMTGAVAFLLGQGQAPPAVAAVPFTGEYTLEVGKLEIGKILHLSFLPVLLTLFLMSFLDTLGTLSGVGAAGGLLDAHGDLPQMERPMLVDAVSCIFSSLVGASTSGAYIESAAGVREGARTGLAAVITGLLFFGALFFIPLFQPLQQLKQVYGPALIAVGALMLASVTRIHFEDMTEAIPAFATIVMMVFTYNIANGLTAGLVLHPLVKAAAGRWADVRPGAIVLAAVCLVYYAYGVPH